MSDIIERIISRNKTWAKEQKDKAPDYFTNLAKGQSPSIFWVGCCDSRVIPSEILQCSLGEVFVQTNIANQIRVDDANTMSSLEYAVNVLRVRHVIVCGHTSCGGLAASMSKSLDNLPGNVQKWIRPLQKMYQREKESLSSENELAKINVRDQLRILADLQFIRDLDTQNRVLTIHGWLFHLETGIVEELELKTVGNPKHHTNP